MAVRRRPVSVMPPPELFVFNSAEWAGAYPDSFEAWRAARREWVKAHPDSPLGNMLDLLSGYDLTCRLGYDLTCRFRRD